jgi:hypothetical protein
VEIFDRNQLSISIQSRIWLIVTNILLFLTFIPSAFAANSSQEGTPFRYVGGHILVIPVKLCDKDSSFVLDTGAGVNALAHSVADSLGYRADGSHSGRRMSGQKLTMETTHIASLQVGPYRQTDVPVALLKTEEFFPKDQEFAGIQGFVSLNFFRSVPFTIDYQNKMIFIETEESLKARAKDGHSVPIKVERKNNIETSIKLPIRFSNGKSANVEVDTGSDVLILNQSYMKSFGISTHDKSLRNVEGKDETGHAYVRYFTQLPVDVFMTGSETIRQSRPKVMFQKIIHQGLIGDAFMHNFKVTYDIPHKRLIFANPN